VDLSLKVREAGYRLLFMAAPTAFHFEARSRQPLVYPREARVLNRRWLLPNHDRYLPYLPESAPARKASGRTRTRARARWQ
jgi:GT2 family glycosyltransferase